MYEEIHEWVARTLPLPALAIAHLKTGWCDHRLTITSCLLTPQEHHDASQILQRTGHIYDAKLTLPSMMHQ